MNLKTSLINLYTLPEAHNLNKSSTKTLLYPLITFNSDKNKSYLHLRRWGIDILNAHTEIFHRASSRLYQTIITINLLRLDQTGLYHRGNHPESPLYTSNPLLWFCWSGRHCNYWLSLRGQRPESLQTLWSTWACPWRPQSYSCTQSWNCWTSLQKLVRCTLT